MNGATGCMARIAAISALFFTRPASQGGAQALGQPVGAIAVGQRADLVVLDGAHPLMAHLQGDDILSRWLFGGTDRLVRDVMVGGNWVVQEGRHAGEVEAGRRFAEVIRDAFA